MATTSKSYCVTCNKQRSTFRCSGCSQEFCFNHLTDHKRQLNKQLDEIEINRDLFQRSLNDRISKPQKHVLIQEIDQWEQDSINKIRQTANETRQTIFEYTNQNIKELELKLTHLTTQLKQSRDENDFSELDLHRWNEQLIQMANELIKPININIRQDNTQLITKIAVDVTSTNFAYKVPVAVSKKWISNGCTIAGGNGRGARINQLSNPWGLWITDDQTVYVADYGNARIIEKQRNTNNGQIVAGGNGKGNDVHQLNTPIDIIMDETNDYFIISDYGNKQVVRWSYRNGGNKQILIGNISCWGIALDNEGYLYVADCNRHEVRKWRLGDTSGVLVAGGNGSGNRLDQLRGRFYICVDDEQSVYISDEENHRIMKWHKGAKEGIIVAGGQGKGNSLFQLSNPEGIAVDSLGNIYIADTDNHRIMRWNKGAKQGLIMAGGYGKGDQANQLSSPLGLKLDRQGNVYVVDNGNCRVQRFDIDPK